MKETKVHFRFGTNVKIIVSINCIIVGVNGEYECLGTDSIKDFLASLPEIKTAYEELSK